MITVSALVRLIPRPPALVDSRKTNESVSGELKLSIKVYLSLRLVLPYNMTGVGKVVNKVM